MSRRLIAVSSLMLAATSVMFAAASKAPSELSLTNLAGKKVSLKDLRGKVVLLNFWATWCGPCKDEMPMLVEESHKWAAKGVVFVGASLDEAGSEKKVGEFAKKNSVDFPIWMGTSEEQLGKLDMGDALPATAFLDGNGVIQLRVSGEIKRAEVEERLAWMTGPKTKPFAAAKTGAKK